MFMCFLIKTITGRFLFFLLKMLMFCSIFSLRLTIFHNYEFLQLGSVEQLFLLFILFNIYQFCIKVTVMYLNQVTDFCGKIIIGFNYENQLFIEIEIGITNLILMSEICCALFFLTSIYCIVTHILTLAFLHSVCVLFLNNASPFHKTF